MQFTDDLMALGATHPDLARDFAGFTGIADVLAWMQRRGLCQAAVDIVGQDEFHYDFLIQLDSAGQWLAWGVT